MSPQRFSAFLLATKLILTDPIFAPGLLPTGPIVMQHTHDEHRAVDSAPQAFRQGLVRLLRRGISLHRVGERLLEIFHLLQRVGGSR